MLEVSSIFEAFVERQIWRQKIKVCGLAAGVAGGVAGLGAEGFVDNVKRSMNIAVGAVNMYVT